MAWSSGVVEPPQAAAPVFGSLGRTKIRPGAIGMTLSTCRKPLPFFGGHCAPIRVQGSFSRSGANQTMWRQTTKHTIRDNFVVQLHRLLDQSLERVSVFDIDTLLIFVASAQERYASVIDKCELIIRVGPERRPKPVQARGVLVLTMTGVLDPSSEVTIPANVRQAATPSSLTRTGKAFFSGTGRWGRLKKMVRPTHSAAPPGPVTRTLGTCAKRVLLESAAFAPVQRGICRQAPSSHLYRSSVFDRCGRDGPSQAMTIS